MSKISTVAVTAVCILLPSITGCSSTQVARSKGTSSPEKAVSSVQLPQIHENAIPNTGTVVEYWPDGKKKSERIYKKGRMTSAIYYASDGRHVYEMAEREDAQSQ